MEEERMQEETVQEEMMQEETTQEETSGAKKTTKKAVFLLAAAAVVLLVAVLAALSLSPGKGGYTFMEAGSGYYIEAMDDTAFSMVGDTAKTGGRWWESVYHSADGSLTVLLDDEQNLYVARKGGATKISGDVSVAAVSFYGDTVAYFKDVKNSVGMLYLYYVGSGTSVLVDKEAYTRNFVLSPDGKSVAYVGNYEVDSWYGTAEWDLFLSTGGGRGEKLYSGGIPVAVMDGGKHIYYIKDDEKLYLDDERIANGVSKAFFFSRDNRELFYNKDGATYYYTAKLSEPVKVKSSSCYGLLMPQGVAEETRARHTCSIVTYGASSFDGVFANLGGDIFYISDRGEKAEKIGTVRSAKVSRDGKGILFLRNGRLYYVKDAGKSPDAEELGSDLSVSSFVASSDLKKIYYESDGEIFFLQGDKGVRVADEADTYIYSEKYGVLFFICDEELFYATTKAKSKEKVMGERTMYMEGVGDEIIFAFRNDRVSRVYKLTGKNKTELLIEVKNDSY